MTLLPASYNFTIWKGSTFREVMTYHQDDEDSPVVDLTGYTALMEIKDVPNGAVLYTLSTSNGQIILGGVAGTITLLIAAEDTATLPWTHGVYELSLSAPSGGDTDSLLKGKIVVRSI